MATIVGTYGRDTLYGTNNNDRMFGFGGTDFMYGRGGDDEMFGGFDRDLLMGGDGRDVLQGNQGNDELHGNQGADRIEGGSGNDQLWPGGGADVLVFIGRDTGRDLVLGFEDGIDLIHIDSPDVARFSDLKITNTSVGGAPDGVRVAWGEDDDQWVSFYGEFDLTARDFLIT